MKSFRGCLIIVYTKHPESLEFMLVNVEQDVQYLLWYVQSDFYANHASWREKETFAVSLIAAGGTAFEGLQYPYNICRVCGSTLEFRKQVLRKYV